MCSSDLKESVEQLILRSSSPSSKSSVTPSTIPSTPLFTPVPPPTTTLLPTFFNTPSNITNPPPLPLPPAKRPPTTPMSTRHFPFQTESGAPKWDGKPENLEQFFSNIDSTCKICISAPSGQDFVEKTFYYLSNEQNRILGQCKPKDMTTADWAQFKKDVWGLYPEFRRDQLYTIPMIEALTANFAQVEKPTINEWGEFSRKFTAMVAHLIDANLISLLDKTRYL